MYLYLLPARGSEHESYVWAVLAQHCSINALPGKIPGQGITFLTDKPVPLEDQRKLHLVDLEKDESLRAA